MWATQAVLICKKYFLRGIHASQNRIESAVDQLHALKNVEPTFTVDRFINDHDYPNTTVRNAGLLDNLKQFSGWNMDLTRMYRLFCQVN